MKLSNKISTRSSKVRERKTLELLVPLYWPNNQQEEEFVEKLVANPESNRALATFAVPVRCRKKDIFEDVESSTRGIVTVGKAISFITEQDTSGNYTVSLKVFIYPPYTDAVKNLGEDIGLDLGIRWFNGQYQITYFDIVKDADEFDEKEESESEEE